MVESGAIKKAITVEGTKKRAEEEINKALNLLEMTAQDATPEALDNLSLIHI